MTEFTAFVQQALSRAHATVEVNQGLPMMEPRLLASFWLQSVHTYMGFGFWIKSLVNSVQTQ